MLDDDVADLDRAFRAPRAALTPSGVVTLAASAKQDGGNGDNGPAIELNEAVACDRHVS